MHDLASYVFHEPVRYGFDNKRGLSDLIDIFTLRMIFYTQNNKDW